MEFDRDCVEYDLEYMRRVENGRVRCCGVDWAAGLLANWEGKTVRVIVRSRLAGAYVAVGSLQDEFIGIAERV